MRAELTRYPTEMSYTARLLDRETLTNQGGKRRMTSATRRLKTSEDRYVSRVFSKPRVIQRADPVVYGGAENGPLSTAQLAFYEQSGYLHFERLFSIGELAPYLEELKRLRSSDSVPLEPESVFEPDSMELRSVFAVHKRNALFARLCNHPRMIDIARQLLGGDVYIHQSRINYKSGFTGKEFYWHSDFETWHIEDGVPAMRMLSCSISLTPNSAFNGPLMIIPSSHRQFVSCVGPTPENNYLHSLRRQVVGVPDQDSLSRLVAENGIVSPTGDIGSVTLFECNEMHGSNSNITPHPRSNIFIVYNSVENTPVDPFGGLWPRPAHIAEREDFTPAGSAY